MFTNDWKRPPASTHVAVPDGFYDRLDEIQHRLHRLRPDWSNTERFFHDRGEIEELIYSLKRSLRPKHTGRR